MGLLQQHQVSAAMFALQQQQQAVVAAEHRLQRELFSLNMQQGLIQAYWQQHQAHTQLQHGSGSVDGGNKATDAGQAKGAGLTQGSGAAEGKENL